MKAKLQEKYMPANYYDNLWKQLVNLKQGSLLMVEYMVTLDKLKTQSQVIEEPCQISALLELA